MINGLPIPITLRNRVLPRTDSTTCFDRLLVPMLLHYRPLRSLLILHVHLSKISIRKLNTTRERKGKVLAPRFELIQQAKAVGTTPELHSLNRITSTLHNPSLSIDTGCLEEEEEEVKLRVLFRCQSFKRRNQIREGGYQLLPRGRLSTRRSIPSVRGVRRRINRALTTREEEENGADGKWEEEDQNREREACRV